MAGTLIPVPAGKDARRVVPDPPRLAGIRTGALAELARRPVARERRARELSAPARARRPAPRSLARRARAGARTRAGRHGGALPLARMRAVAAACAAECSGLGPA